MKNTDEYLTIARPSTGLYKEKGSKFISYAFPVTSAEQVRVILARLKKEHRSAQHHCYAYILGIDRNEYRVNDDGEPPHTAGKPIMGQISSRKLTNILVVVIRYFGGILLGKGGLIQAYKHASAGALENATAIKMIQKEIYRVRFDYKDMNAVMKIIGQAGLEVISQKYEQMAEIKISIRRSITPGIIHQFKMFNNILVEYLETK